VIQIATLIHRLRELGGEVFLVGGRLRVRGPAASAEAREIVEKLRQDREGCRSLLVSTAPLGKLNSQGELVMTREDLPEFARRMRALGWEVEWRGQGIVCRNPSTRSNRKAGRKKVDAQQLETARNITAPPVLPTQPCYACGSTLFWVSVYDVVICATCHPPASERQVKGWHDVTESEPESTPRSRAIRNGACRANGDRQLKFEGNRDRKRAG
jgi:hypothetical protein